MRANDGPAAHVEQRGDHSVSAEPLHAVDHARDIDDRVERAHLVEMNLLDRHAVNRGLSLAEPVEQVNRAILPFTSKGRAFDEAGDGLQAVMRPVMRRGRTVTVAVIVGVRSLTMAAVLVMVMMMGLLVMPGGHRRHGTLVDTRNLVAETPALSTRSADTEQVPIARLPSAARKPSIGSPKSSNAPRTMSPEAPEKQSK